MFVEVVGVVAWDTRAARLARYNMAFRSNSVKTDPLVDHEDYRRQELLVNGRRDYSRRGSYGSRPNGSRRY